MADTALLEKLRKVKALADEAQDDNECQTAMLMFQQLLDKNGLDVAEVEAAAPDGKTKPEEVDLYEGERIEKWRHYLHTTIAGHFRCVAITVHTRCFGQQSIQQLQFIGHRQDVLIAKEAYLSAIAAAERLYSRHKLRMLENEAFAIFGLPMDKPNRSRYMMGFSIGLQSAYARQEAESTFDIILTTPADVQAYIADMGCKRHLVDARVDREDGNTSAGYSDGYNVGRGDRLPDAGIGDYADNPTSNYGS